MRPKPGHGAEHRDGRDRERAPPPLAHEQREAEEAEQHGRMARDEGAVVVALVAADEGRGELLGAAELGYLRRPRAAPIVLERRVDEQPRPEREHQHEIEDGGDAESERPAPPDRSHAEQDDEDADQDRRQDADALVEEPREDAALEEEARVGPVEEPGRPDVDAGKQPEDEADEYRNRDEAR